MEKITANELRQKYLDFFQSKKHIIIPSAPLVPENDPTVLFTTAGMHPLVPFLMGEKHPQGDMLANSQKCVRTGDIDEVGDNRHLTFFEMLGNWSLGSYFKKEAIEWSWEFLTDAEWLGLDPSRLFVTVFAGDENAPRDDESIKIWQQQFEKVGIESGICESGCEAQEDSRIFLLGAEDNWWGPAGETGPCGPCTEMFWDTRPEEGKLSGSHEKMVESFRLMEIWNDVFMEFEKKSDGSFEKMSHHNVDTGMGLERTLTVLSGKANVFETELFEPIIAKIEEISGVKYEDQKNSMRIVADHLKASVFLLADGIEPSNTERGYVLRRLIRRAIRQGHLLGIDQNFIAEVAKIVQEMYGGIYPEVLDPKISINLTQEEEKFRKTLERGLKRMEAIFFQDSNEVKSSQDSSRLLDYSHAFDLYQNYGFPLEMFLEELKKTGLEYSEKDLIREFNEELKKHQDLSRTASAGMFKGGLADNKEETTQLHTVAHLMLAGLRKTLGGDVHQKGSNINGERLRFDFSYGEKMTEQQKKAVEDFVNQAISAKVPVEMNEMTLEEARESGAEGVFDNKYGEKVKVYEIPGFSKEICGGPHVKNTGEIAKVFKIKKEESSGAGVRRIKAVLE